MLRLVGVMLCAGLGGRACAQKPVVLEGHENVVSSLSFSADGTRLISGSWDKTVRVWDVRTGTSEAVLRGHRDWVFAVVSPDEGTALASASQRGIRVWDSRTGSERHSYTGLGGAAVNSVVFSPDGKLVASGRRDGTARVWQVGDTQSMTTFGGFESWVSSLAFTPDGRTLAAGTRTGRIRLFDLHSRRERVTVAGHAGQQVMSLAVNPAGDTLASGSYDQTVRLWDLRTGEESAKLTGHRGVVTSVAWSRDGKHLASGERHGHIKVWNIAGGNQLITTLPGHSDNQLGFTVTTLAFSPDGRRLASGSYDKTIRLWTMSSE